MQGLDNREAQTSQRDNAPRDGLSPGPAAAIVLGLIAVAGLIFFLTKSDAEPIEPPAQTLPTTSPNSATAPEPLTEAEAISTFRELSGNSVTAVRDRDLASLGRVFAEGSPAFDRAEQAVKELRRDHVRDESRLRVANVEVLASTPEEVRLLASTTLRPCFRDSSGRDVTEAPRKLERTSVWTLVSTPQGWRISDAVIKKEKVVGRGSGGC